MEKAKLDPVKVPSAQKQWLLMYSSTSAVHDSLKAAREDIKNLRSLGIAGEVHLYELIEIHRD